MTDPQRVDKWLWAARLVKTRALAVEAVNGGRVHVNGQRVKPSKDVRPGDELEITVGPVRRTVVIRGTGQGGAGALRGDAGQRRAPRAPRGRGEARAPAHPDQRPAADQARPAADGADAGRAPRPALTACTAGTP